MDLTKIISELRAELELIDNAIDSLENVSSCRRAGNPAAKLRPAASSQNPALGPRVASAGGGSD